MFQVLIIFSVNPISTAHFLTRVMAKWLSKPNPTMVRYFRGSRASDDGLQVQPWLSHQFETID